MITQTDRATYTPQEYLDRELASETRSEYRNGKIFPMTGGTPDHNCISGNLYMALRLFLKRKPYEDREISLSFPIFDLNIAIDELYEGVEFAEM